MDKVANELKILAANQEKRIIDHFIKLLLQYHFAYYITTQTERL